MDKDVISPQIVARTIAGAALASPATSRTNSPIPDREFALSVSLSLARRDWATLSDTIIAKESATNHNDVDNSDEDSEVPGLSNVTTLCDPQHRPIRSFSVPDLGNKKTRLSDEEIRQMRDHLLMFARPQNRALLRTFTRRQIFILLSIGFCYFASFCSISLLAPFFPPFAETRGMSLTTAGLVFCSHAFVVFVTSPFMGQILPTIGPKFMLVTGISLCGSCVLLFGFLDQVGGGSTFTIYCFMVRGTGAVGAAAFSTAGATFVAEIFPDKISAVMGILETFVGLGFSVGPAIGGVLYTAGGFGLPFFVLGSVTILAAPLNYYALPNLISEKTGNYTASLLSIVKAPGVAVVCLVIALSSSAWSVLEPTLSPHMKQFELSIDQVGLLFLLTSVTYAVFSPVWGWVNDRFGYSWRLMFFGSALTGASLLAMGPSELLPFVIPNILTTKFVTLGCLGLAVSMAYLPTYQVLLDFAIDGGCETEMATFSFVAGLWASMYSLGEVIGPAMGGVLADHFGFAFSMTVMGLLNLAVAVIVALYQLGLRISSYREKKRLKLGSTTARAPLGGATVATITDKTPLLKHVAFESYAGNGIAVPDGLSCKISELEEDEWKDKKDDGIARSASMEHQSYDFLPYQ